MKNKSLELFNSEELAILEMMEIKGGRSMMLVTDEKTQLGGAGCIDGQCPCTGGACYTGQCVAGCACPPK